jgi:hypothetical protein
MMIGRISMAAALAVAVAIAGGCGDDDAAAPGGNPSCTGPADELPEDLACTGLYADFATKAISPKARPYAPAVAFWSDGLDKDRYIQIPDGQTIDITAADDWKFPVGTKVWKDIHKGPKKIETRYFLKLPDQTWTQTTYVWTEDGSKAVAGPGQDVMVDGQKYHIPSTSECGECHKGRRDRMLGFEAISLGQPGATGLTLDVLAKENKLSPAPARTTVTVAEPALAALHVNCGITCHNNNSGATAYSTNLRMRLGFEEVATKPVDQWEVFGSLVNANTTSPGREGKRIVPGKPEESALIEAINHRGPGQMPPLATTVVDTKMVDTVSNWVKGLH